MINSSETLVISISEVNSFWCVRDKGKFAMVMYYTHLTFVIWALFVSSITCDYLSIYFSVYLSICLSIYLSVCLSIYLSISIYLFIYLSICVYLSIYIYIVYLFLSIYTYIYVYIFQGLNLYAVSWSSHNLFAFPSVTVAKAPLTWSVKDIEIYVKVWRSVSKWNFWYLSWYLESFKSLLSLALRLPNLDDNSDIQ